MAAQIPSFLDLGYIRFFKFILSLDFKCNQINFYLSSVSEMILISVSANYI